MPAGRVDICGSFSRIGFGGNGGRDSAGGLGGSRGCDSSSGLGGNGGRDSAGELGDSGGCDSSGGLGGSGGRDSAGGLGGNGGSDSSSGLGGSGGRDSAGGLGGTVGRDSAGGLGGSGGRDSAGGLGGTVGRVGAGDLGSTAGISLLANGSAEISPPRKLVDFKSDWRIAWAIGSGPIRGRCVICLGPRGADRGGNEGAPFSRTEREGVGLPITALVLKLGWDDAWSAGCVAERGFGLSGRGPDGLWRGVDGGSASCPGAVPQRFLRPVSSSMSTLTRSKPWCSPGLKFSCGLNVTPISENAGVAKTAAPREAIWNILPFLISATIRPPIEALACPNQRNDRALTL